MKNGFRQVFEMADIARSKNDLAISSESYGPDSNPIRSSQPVDET